MMLPFKRSIFMGIEDIELDGFSKTPFIRQNEATPLTEEEKMFYNRVKAASTAIPDLVQTFQNPIKASLPEETETLLKTNSVASPIRCRNLGLTACQLGAKVEKNMSSKILNYIQEASDLQKKIDLLVDLNGKLAIHGDNENEKLITPEIRGICKELKEKGIDLLPEKEQKISRERLAEIKANISAQTDRLKTGLQILFTTKIQVGIQEVQSLLDCMKMIEKYSRSTPIIHNMKAGG